MTSVDIREYFERIGVRSEARSVARTDARRQGYNQTMPTILREGPYQFYFVSADRDEPPHIHVRRDDGFAKFWLSPVELQTSGHFGRAEIRRIHRIVERNRARFLEEWNDYFDR